ncbi:MAG: DUF4249 family protein [Bacteroidales bacterium]|nr:DUF4249 family protein [Bacteroidales bacterium]MBR1436698.1 DUF4249 family protein [Bacteroidales bacterium]
MKLKFKYSLFLLLFSAQMLPSCVETFVMDPHEEKQIVVNCILKAYSRYHRREETQTMDLLFLKGKSEKEIVPITDAKAYLIHGTDTVCYFKHVEGTVWETDRAIVIFEEDSYILGVEVQGFEKIKARTSTPSSPPFSSYETFHYGNRFHTRKEDSFKLWFFPHKDEDHKESFEYIATDHLYADDFNITGKRLSEFGYEGDERVWEILRNAGKLSYYMTLFPNRPLHKEFLRIDHPKNYDNPYNEYEVIPDSGIGDSFYFYCGPFDCHIDMNKTKEASDGTICYKVGSNGHLHIYSLSDEYDTYLKEVYLKLGKLENDLTAVYSIENLYTNINGGIGIFGSYSTWGDPKELEAHDLYLRLPWISNQSKSLYP